MRDTLENRDQEKRILAIDYGEKRIGIAVTDPLMMFAYPLVTLANDGAFWSSFQKIISEYNVIRIILGYPLKESGEESKSTKMVLDFRKILEKKVAIPIELIDERYSSEIARQHILESVVSKKKRRDKSLLDKNAASVILQDYLNSLQ